MCSFLPEVLLYFQINLFYLLFSAEPLVLFCLFFVIATLPAVVSLLLQTPRISPGQRRGAQSVHPLTAKRTWSLHPTALCGRGAAWPRPVSCRATEAALQEWLAQAGWSHHRVRLAILPWWLPRGMARGDDGTATGCPVPRGDDGTTLCFCFHPLLSTTSSLLASR